MRRRLLKIAEGASLATGAGLKYRDYENPFDDMINVKCLTSLCRHHFEDLGIEGFVPEEQYPGSGSSDIGNVSYICPTVYCEIALEGEGDPVVVHEKSALSLVNSPRASKLMEKVVRAYTYSAIDLCLDDTLCQKAREEHRKNVELHQWRRHNSSFAVQVREGVISVVSSYFGRGTDSVAHKSICYADQEGVLTPANSSVLKVSSTNQFTSYLNRPFIASSSICIFFDMVCCLF